MSLNMLSIVARAAARAPGPVAERSLAAWRSLVVPDIRISDPEPTDIRVALGEQWCVRCYESTAQSDDVRATCPRCGCRRFVPATNVLRPEEYYIAS